MDGRLQLPNGFVEFNSDQVPHATYAVLQVDESTVTLIFVQEPDPGVVDVPELGEGQELIPDEAAQQRKLDVVSSAWMTKEHFTNWLRSLSSLPEFETPKGRNKPCHCGSGRKFKHCHGRDVK